MSAEDITAAIAKTLSTIRRQRGFTLQEVADRSGMAKSQIWELENARGKNPSIKTAISLAQALGISLDRLTGLSTAEIDLHPEALRIACEVDALLRRASSPLPDKDA